MINRETVEADMLGMVLHITDAMPKIREALAACGFQSKQNERLWKLIEEHGTDLPLLSQHLKGTGWTSGTVSDLVVGDHTMEDVDKACDLLREHVALLETQKAVELYQEEITAGSDPGAAYQKLIASSPTRKKPIILDLAHTRDLQVRQAETALRQADEPPTIFERSGKIVRVARTRVVTNPKKGITRQAGTPVIVPVGAAYLMRKMGEAADWRRPAKGSKTKYDRTGCPKVVVEMHMDSVGEWPWEALAGHISAPTLRPDGSLLQKPGYDPETGLFCVFSAGDFPEIPDKPSKDQAARAMMELYDLVVEFLFAEEADRSVAIAAVLTSLVRRSLPKAPMHAVRGTRPGEGKSTVADIASLIATGTTASMISQASNDEEERKRWFALLSGGDQVICIDNIERPLGSAVLCQVLTQETITDRKLGVSDAPTVPTHATVLATGNGLSITGDLVKRTVIADLDSKMEFPEHRRFHRDIYTYAREHRGELVKHALTVLRAYSAAGQPNVSAEHWSRFPEWCQLVRNPIVWLGLEDPYATNKKLDMDDPERTEHAELLQAWHDCYQDRPLTAATIIADLYRDSQLDSVETRLKTAMEVACAGKRGVTGRTLGEYLRKKKARIQSGMKVVKAGAYQNAAVWKVVGEKVGVGESRESRDPVQPTTQVNCTTTVSSARAQYEKTHETNGGLSEGDLPT